MKRNEKRTKGQRAKRQTGLGLSPQAFMISASLAKGPSHGYAIAKRIETETNGQVSFSAGTLYGNLSQMRDYGLIENAGERVEHGKTQRVYKLTKDGESQFKEQIEILKKFLQ